MSAREASNGLKKWIGIVVVLVIIAVALSVYSVRGKGRNANPAFLTAVKVLYIDVAGVLWNVRHYNGMAGSAQAMFGENQAVRRDNANILSLKPAASEKIAREDSLHITVLVSALTNDSRHGAAVGVGPSFYERNAVEDAQRLQSTLDGLLEYIRSYDPSFSPKVP